MWKRFVKILRCPLCSQPLELESFVQERVPLTADHIRLAQQRELLADDFDVYVDAGLLLCEACRLRFPIMDGLPVLLPYVTPLHLDFEKRWKSERVSRGIYHSYAGGQPVTGEEFVARSFSTEWLAYDYDGVIWDLSYEAHRERIIKEIGPALQRAKWYLEVGCGIGLATSVAQENANCDAVGVDLSLAALKAARQFRANPFMHFVQASAFSIPLCKDFFDVIYSRGVLHHTYNTESAFRSVATHCRKGGTFYLWVYGPKSITSNPLRLGLYGLEALIRPVLSRDPDSRMAKAVLGAMALGYVGFNRIRRLKSGEIQLLTFSRGVHSARDRFTPRFAHRQGEREIIRWFSACGYERPTVLDWRSMPEAEREDFRRNVGVRAIRATA